MYNNIQGQFGRSVVLFVTNVYHMALRATPVCLWLIRTLTKAHEENGGRNAFRLVRLIHISFLSFNISR